MHCSGSGFIQETIVKQVFPELRRKARERGDEVVDVDLRWGVGHEQVKPVNFERAPG